MATFVVLFNYPEEEGVVTSIETLAHEIQDAYDTGGYFEGNYLVLSRTDDDEEFWTKWKELSPRTVTPGGTDPNA